jgi:hypothetical protein
MTVSLSIDSEEPLRAGLAIRGRHAQETAELGGGGCHRVSAMGLKQMTPKGGETVGDAGPHVPSSGKREQAA